MTAERAHASFALVRRWWQAITIVVSLVIVIINSILLWPLLGQVSDQSAQGEKARNRQCQVAPIADKVFERAQDLGWITEADLAVYRRGVPPVCLK